MQNLFTNVFIKKDMPFDDCINITFWIVLVTNNVLKWLFVFYVVLVYKPLLIAFLLFSPCLKIILIGIRNLKQFKEKFQRGVFILFMVTESIYNFK